MSESQQIDTTTEAGWDACVKAFYNGEEIEFEYATRDGWGGCSNHPSLWMEKTIYRIKPARIPEVGDVWERKANLQQRIMVTGVCIGVSHCYTVSPDFNSGCKKLSHLQDLWKFIGKIDFSLLTKEE